MSARPSRSRGCWAESAWGGLIVIAGILIAILWKVWLGIIIILIGLIAFGGFVKGKWY